MEKLVIEKKFKKLGTIDLEARVKRGNLSIFELGVAGEILKSRESKLDVEIFVLRKKVEKHLDDLQAANSHVAYSKIEEVLGDCEVNDLGKEELQIILEIKGEKQKTTSKPSIKRQTLSDEDSEKIKSIVDESSGSKKELIITLLETGITKQQLDKYRPSIAHWSYIYEIANQLGK